MSNPTVVNLSLIKQVTPPGDAVNIALTKFGEIPSIGVINLRTAAGMVDLSVIDNGAKDTVLIALPDGRIGAANLVEPTVITASPVRICVDDGVIKAWAIKQ